MRGYVQNTGNQAFFVLQRQIPPGAKVTLEDAYKSVGKKSDLGSEDVAEFVEFLKSTVLTRGSWSFFENDGTPLGAPKKRKVTKKEKISEQVTQEQPLSTNTSSKAENDARGAGRNMRRNRDESSGAKVTPADIIEASYDHARALIEKCNDRGTLKKALHASQHFAGKDQHMRHLMKRLEQVY